jgi:hypothetical protein
VARTRVKATFWCVFEKVIERPSATLEASDAPHWRLAMPRRPRGSSLPASSALSRGHLKARRPPRGARLSAPGDAEPGPLSSPRRSLAPSGGQRLREAGSCTILPADEPPLGRRRGRADPRAAAKPPRGARHPAAPAGDPTHPEAPSELPGPARAAPAAAELSLLRRGRGLGSTSRSGSRGASRDPGGRGAVAARAG